MNKLKVNPDIILYCLVSLSESPIKQPAATISLSHRQIASKQSPYNRVITVGQETFFIPPSIMTMSKDESEEHKRKRNTKRGFMTFITSRGQQGSFTGLFWK